ncbi:hypothetical protein DPMN_071668 [Dreissena polymorpha]|uniref:Uncharacterized protein n=1 Tax=Dreissena polymorpha TaxID=45954 RepID=A0A9D4BPV4_DREPO|nr:hypothetical protein DPMN_071668 [Dreissena polymorpha]
MCQAGVVYEDIHVTSGGRSVVLEDYQGRSQSESEIGYSAAWFVCQDEKNGKLAHYDNDGETRVNGWCLEHICIKNDNDSNDNIALFDSTSSTSTIISPF